MKQVRAFETKDGKVFNDRVKAENHELMINFRGLLQSQGRGGSLNATDVATVLAKQHEQVYNLISSYRRTMGSIKAAKTRNQ